MRRFFYKAKKDGLTVTGIIEAKGEKEAAKFLHEQGLLILSISAERKELFTRLFSFFTRRVTLGDVVRLTRQLSSMITAGLTLTEALSVLQNQVEKEGLRWILEETLSDIEGGSSLSVALARHPRVFKPVYVAMIAAAEEAGLLDQVLARLADNLEKEKALRGKIIGALIYPAIVIIGMVAVFLIMMFFVIPALKTIYEDLNVTLPLPTRIIISISNFATQGWYLVVGFLALFFLLLSSYRKTEVGQRQIDAFLWRIPIFGKLRRLVILTEMTRTLGLLVGAGTPIIRALNITGETTGSTHYQEALSKVARKVEKGVSLGEALSEDPFFPPILIQMGRVGETTGKLDETLLKVSTYFETEVEQLIKTLTTLLEPFIMVILGVGVAFLLISIIVPIYNLTSAF